MALAVADCSAAMALAVADCSAAMALAVAVTDTLVAAATATRAACSAAAMLSCTRWSASFTYGQPPQPMTATIARQIPTLRHRIPSRDRCAPLGSCAPEPRTTRMPAPDQPASTESSVAPLPVCSCGAPSGDAKSHCAVNPSMSRAPYWLRLAGTTPTSRLPFCTNVPGSALAHGTGANESPRAARSHCAALGNCSPAQRQ